MPDRACSNGDHPAARAVWPVVVCSLAVIQAMSRHRKAAFTLWPPSSELLAGWVQFDGPEYLQIAAEGYQQRQLVWFPLYPLLIRALTPILRDPTLAAVTVSVLSGLVALLVYRWWLRDALDAPSARLTALLVLAVYPYAWFLYGAVYADALFVALALMAFLAVERDRLGVATLAALLATATRPSGFAVVVGILVLALERSGALRSAWGPGWRRALGLPSGFERRALRSRTLLPLAGMVGLGAFAAYQWVAFGSPLRWVTEQSNYHDTGSATLLKVQYFSAWTEGFDGRHLATTTFQAAILLAVILSVPAVGRRFGWGYGAYVLCLAAFPGYSVSTFMGVGRYMLPAFPAFALLGEWLDRHPRLRAPWLVTSAVLLMVMTFGFARSWYLA